MEVDDLEIDLSIRITDSKESSLWFVFVSSKHKISEFREILEKKERNVVFVDSEELDLLKDNNHRTRDIQTFYVGMPIPPEEHDGPLCDGTRNMNSQTISGSNTIDSSEDKYKVPFVEMHSKCILGRGASGVCAQLTDGYSKDVAYKTISRKDKFKAKRELETMVKFMGNGLPRIFTIKETDYFYGIYMELIFPCISMTDLTKRLACIRNSVEDRGRRFFHYFFYMLLGEIKKFHDKGHTHGDLGESKNESNILLQKTEVHSVAVRLIDPGDVNHEITIDLADISIHMCTIGRECSFIEDPIFNRFIKGIPISTEKQAEDLRQELSNEGETFESDKVYSKKIIDAIFDEPKDEATVQSLGNIRDMVSGAQIENGDTGEPEPMEPEGPQGSVIP
ncbi:uncharacterized protein [Mytilus edulis]|uniref:uncharacterized protein n=1 Tax=Mytilus edulis TaxID=6550 RepID=UPI0039F11920